VYETKDEFRGNRFQDKFEELKKAYPGSRLLIVSNTAGTASDAGFVQAKVLERNTGVEVLRHNVKVSRGSNQHYHVLTSC